MGLHQQKKAQIQTVLSGLPKHVQMSEIARDIGVEPAKLYNFSSKGYLKKDVLDKLESWLGSHGFLSADFPSPDLSTPTLTPDHNPTASGPWLRTKNNPPEPNTDYWVITHSLKRGHRPGVGYFIGDEFGWSVNGSAGGPPKMRPRVVWHAEIIYPEID